MNKQVLLFDNDENADILARQRVKVLFPLPLFNAYDYLVPAGQALKPGTFVKAPFGPRSIWGVVWPEAIDETLSAEKIKTIETVSDFAPLSADMLDFIDWAATYVMSARGVILRMVMRGGDWLNAPSPLTAYAPSGSPPARMTPQRQKVMDILSPDDPPRSAGVIAEAAGVSEGVIRGLVGAGALERQLMDPDSDFDVPDPSRAREDLSQTQQVAVDAIVARFDETSGAVTLIDGVTGSGKTEVYLEAAAAMLKRDPTAQLLILIPEIALTTPFLARVEERFGAAPAPWHSELTMAQRRRTWRRVGEGQARIVVGARSALFLPFQSLKLIIVDEEHDSAFKQEDGVIYHARDLAVARAKRGGFGAVLASATPSLETVVNVDEGRYGAVALPTRFAAARLPDISLIDMRTEEIEQGSWISPTLVSATDETLARKEQALLFLNRRGYAPLTLCRRCGHKMTAPDSDTMLVEHRFENRLVCHHTGYSIPKPTSCPACNVVDSLQACGPGVERVAEEALARWPDATIAVLSSDTTPGAVAMRALLQSMSDGEIDILIATQVAAKGHHFPNLTLVGVVDADMGLAGGDLRASERTYQLLAQVAGRAGRAEKPGRAMLQTYQPDAPVFAALSNGDRDGFLVAEAQGRSALGFPPYGRLAAIIMSGPDENAVLNAARDLSDAKPHGDGIDVLGPSRAPIYRLRGRVRLRFLVRARKGVNIQAFLSDWVRRVKTPNSVRRVIDIDPYSFL